MEILVLVLVLVSVIPISKGLHYLSETMAGNFEARARHENQVEEAWKRYKDKGGK